MAADDEAGFVLDFPVFGGLDSEYKATREDISVGRDFLADDNLLIASDISGLFERGSDFKSTSVG